MKCICIDTFDYPLALKYMCIKKHRTKSVWGKIYSKTSLLSPEFTLPLNALQVILLFLYLCRNSHYFNVRTLVMQQRCTCIVIFDFPIGDGPTTIHFIITYGLVLHCNIALYCASCLTCIWIYLFYLCHA